MSSNLNYVTLGFQYGFISASSLLVAFAYGLPVARRWATRFSSWWSLGRERIRPIHLIGRRQLLRRVVPTVLLVTLVAANVALSPVNPAMDNHGLGSAYRLSYSPSPGDAEVDQLAALIPPGATVVASDNLFPIVANDGNGYSFAWTSDPGLGLPFNATHLPPYVFVAEDSFGSVTPWIADAVNQPALYGVRGVVWSSDAGVVLLYETGYRGPPTQFGSTPSDGGTYFGHAIVSPEAGEVSTTAGEAFSNVVESAPGARGSVWSGPDSNLPAGNYSVLLSLRVLPIPGAPTPFPGDAVVSVTADAFGLANLVRSNLTFANLDGSSWRTVDLSLNLSEPAIGFSVEGWLWSSSVQVTLNYLEIGGGGDS